MADGLTEALEAALTVRLPKPIIRFLMANSATATASAVLTLLNSEASRALQEAKRLREQLNALPQNDPQRPLLETSIKEAVDRANRLSSAVTSTASST